MCELNKEEQTAHIFGKVSNTGISKGFCTNLSWSVDTGCLLRKNSVAVFLLIEKE